MGKSYCLTGEKRSELCRGFELWNRIEFFERRSESVCQTPSCGRRKLLELRIEIEVMHSPRKMFRCFKFPFHERSVNDELRCFIRKQDMFPCIDLLTHWFKVALHTIHANRDRIDETEVFRMLREDRTEITLECHVVANEDTIPDRHREAHRLVIRVSNTNREATPFEGGFEVKNSEHFHSVFGDCVLVSNDRDVPEL